MSIHAILGKPGAGKSYEAVQRAYAAVEVGRVVITNLPLKTTHPFWKAAIENGLLVLFRSVKTKDEGDDHFGHWMGWETVTDKKHQREIEGSKGEASKLGPLVIVDECLVNLGPMVRTKRKSTDWPSLMELFAVHRHSLIDIILMFHDHGQCDSEIKQVIERWHHVVNTSEMTGKNTYVVKVSNKGFVVGNAFIEKRQGFFKKKIYELYDSYSEGEGAGTTGKKGEGGLRRSRPLWLRWWAILLMICLVLLPVMMIKTVTGTKSVISGDSLPAEFGSGGSVTFVDDTAPVVAPTKPTILNQLTLDLGWPDPSIPMMGYDSENIYFTSGTKLNLLVDIYPSGYTILESHSCRVTLARRIFDNELGWITKIIEYTCIKGF